MYRQKLVAEVAPFRWLDGIGVLLARPRAAAAFLLDELFQPSHAFPDLAFYIQHELYANWVWTFTRAVGPVMPAIFVTSMKMIPESKPAIKYV